MHSGSPLSPRLHSILRKTGGIIVSLSPLAVWMTWQTLPSLALLAPLAVVGLLAAAALACKRSLRKELSPVLPAIRFTLAAGLAFTAAALASVSLFIYLPMELADMGFMPPSLLIPLIQTNLLVHLGALGLLTLAAAYSCLRCVISRGITV